MRGANFAVAQEGEEMTRGGLLAGMGTRVVDALIESDRGALERFQGHCAGYIGDARQPFGAEKGKATNGVHRLGAVEEG